MTAVAGLVQDGEVWIAADSAGVSGQNLSIRADAKAFRNGPYVFGFTTSFRMGQLLRWKLNPPVPGNDDGMEEFMCTRFADAVRDCLKTGGWAEKANERESGGNFLVGAYGRLFEVYSDYQVAEREDQFAATGCGESFLLGSLHTTEQLGWPPEKRLLAALETAERFSTGVQGPFRIVSTEAP